MRKSATKTRHAQWVSDQLETFVQELLGELDQRLDKRLVRTFLLTLQAIIMFRHSSQGLLLSELGGYILGPAQAPAGTKRLSNLLRSPRWTYRLIATFLWRRANRRVTELLQDNQPVLVVWDESVWEKPESLAAEGLSAVRSSKAQRLKRVKPGFYNPPGGRPVFVPGLNWISLLVLGRTGTPTLAAMRWWSTRGKFATDKAVPRHRLLKLCARWWGQAVIHIWDRGYGHGPWLNEVLRYPVRFVVRWPKAYHLVDAKGKRAAWKITRGKRSLSYRLIWDAQRRCQRKTGLYFCSVIHPDQPNTPLWLVVSRPGPGRPPMYLLTNEALHSSEAAWQIVFFYMRRWQVEMSYRFAKTELAMQSPRLWHWHTRLKLLLMVSLVYAFLLSLLAPPLCALRQWLLRHFCHRTGKRYRETSIPLYRLRSALSRLWLAHPPSPRFLFENPG
jgi:hypothetical protein